MGKIHTKPHEIPFITSENIEFFKKEIKVGFKRFNISIVNSGEPHVVVFLEDNRLYHEDLEKINVELFGRMIRNHPMFPIGTNVNFAIVVDENTIKVRTYERGVERETNSCGTGSTASVFVAHQLGLINNDRVEIIRLGGKHTVLRNNDNTYSLFACPTMLYGGKIEL
jgi:diaminopimelate epimerase